MTCFIAVTTDRGNQGRGCPLLVNMDRINTISADTDGTAVLWRSGEEIHCRETPAQILALIKEAGQ